MPEQLKEELERKIANKALIDKYPFLIPRNVWTGEVPEDYDYSYCEKFDDGWEEIFLKVCDVIKEEWDSWNEETRKNFYFTELKEKWGGMRVYTTFYSERIENAINIANFLSHYTCIKCGKQPRTLFGGHKIWNTRGWIVPLCKECAKKLGESTKVDRHNNIFTSECWSREKHYKNYWKAKKNDDILRAAPVKSKDVKDKK